MAFELVYTSAPEGVRRGSSGFCVVACTQRLGPRLVVTLEGLSAYKPLYAHYAENAWDNPISRSHYLYDQAGEKLHILSRVCFNGVDHTQRSNKLASHIVLNAKESQRAQGGPADLLGHEELFKNASWQIHAEEYPLQLQIPPTTAPLKKCALWESVTGDAGWGGFLIDKYLAHPERSIYIAYAPEQHAMLLPLLQEALALLPEAKRWEVTFNTYFVTLPAGMQCAIRCCIAGSEALVAARRSPLNTIVDFTHLPTLPLAGKYVDAARSGIAPESSPDADAVHPVIRRVVSESKQSDREQRRFDDLSPAANADATNGKNPDETGVPTTRKRTFNRILVVALLFLVVIASLGFGGWTWHRLRQLQDQRNEICRRYITMKQNYDLFHQSIPQKPVKPEELRHYVEELRSRQQLLLEMEHAAGNLRSQQKFSDDETIQIAIIQLSDLITQCNALSNELQKKIDDAERNLNALRQQEEKKKEVQQNLLGNAPETTAEKTSSKEKDRTDTPSTFPATPDPNGSHPKPQKTSDVILSGSPEYLWIKGEENIPLRPKKIIRLSVKGSNGKIFLADEGSFDIGENYTRPSGVGGDELIIQSEMTGGVLTITNSGDVDFQKGIVIEMDDEVYPLCFVLGTSKITPPEKNEFSLTFDEGKYTINFSVQKNQLRRPKKYIRCNSAKNAASRYESLDVPEINIHFSLRKKQEEAKIVLEEKELNKSTGEKSYVWHSKDQKLKGIYAKMESLGEIISDENLQVYREDFPKEGKDIEEDVKNYKSKAKILNNTKDDVEKELKRLLKITQKGTWKWDECAENAAKLPQKPPIIEAWYKSYISWKKEDKKLKEKCANARRKYEKDIQTRQDEIRKELAELELVLVVGEKEYPQGIIMRLGTKK